MAVTVKAPNNVKGAVKLRAEIAGFKELKAALDTGDPFFVGPWREALIEGAETVVSLAQRRAPNETGALAASIHYKLDSRPVPMWARVTANKTKGKAKYGYILNYSRKRVYRFRSGPIVGSKTVWWFSFVKKDLVPVINKMLSTTADGLVAAWRARGGH